MIKSINPLLCYLQAKDIPEVLDELESIPCDKLYIKYYEYPYPHRIARDYFLSHPEYTHLIIQPPDLIVKKEHFEKLKQDLIEHPFIEILGGVCNVDLDENKDSWAICFNLPSLEFHNRVYHWVKKQNFDYPIIRVRHCGHVFMFVSRQVVENLTINGEEITGTNRPGYDGCDWKDNKDGFAADLFFCTNCYKSNIPIYVDTHVDMMHLRFQGELLVGKRESQTVFVPWVRK